MCVFFAMAEATRSKTGAKAKGEEQTEARVTGEHRKEKVKATLSPEHLKHVSEQAKKAETKANKEAQLQALRAPELTAKVLQQKGLTASKEQQTEHKAATSTSNKGTPPRTASFSLATPAPEQDTEQPRLTSPTPMQTEVPPLQVPDWPFLGATDAPAVKGSVASSSGQVRQDPTLTALERLLAPLTAKLDNLALNAVTKTDLTRLQEDLKEHTKQTVDAAVAPVQAEVQQLSTRVTKLESGTSSGEAGKLLDALDPAHKRVDFVGFRESDSADQRLKAMEEYLAKFPSCKPLALGNYYTGPYNARTLTKAGYAEYTDADAAKASLKQLKGDFESNGVKVTVKAALPKKNLTRNWALRKAEELLKKDTPNKVVKLVWSERRVTVNDVPSFKQDKSELRGSFCPPYTHLQLPN